MQAVQDEHTLRLERLETKVDSLDGRLGKVETRLEKVEAQLEAMPRTIAEMMSEMIDASEKRIMARLPGVRNRLLRRPRSVAGKISVCSSGARRSAR